MHVLFFLIVLMYLSACIRAVSTYMVPLQEHQRPAPVLLQQLLSALLRAQLSLSDLLALHRTSTLGYGLHHVIYTDGLCRAHALYGGQKHNRISRIKTVRRGRIFTLYVNLQILVMLPGRPAEAAGRLRVWMSCHISGSVSSAPAI